MNGKKTQNTGLRFHIRRFVITNIIAMNSSNLKVQLMLSIGRENWWTPAWLVLCLWMFLVNLMYNIKKGTISPRCFLALYRSGSLRSGDSKGGPGWAMPPPDFCLDPRLPPPVFFLISRLSSFGW